MTFDAEDAWLSWQFLDASSLSSYLITPSETHHLTFTCNPYFLSSHPPFEDDRDGRLITAIHLAKYDGLWHCKSIEIHTWRNFMARMRHEIPPLFITARLLTFLTSCATVSRQFPMSYEWRSSWNPYPMTSHPRTHLSGICSIFCSENLHSSFLRSHRAPHPSTPGPGTNSTSFLLLSNTSFTWSKPLFYAITSFLCIIEMAGRKGRLSKKNPSYFVFQNSYYRH